MKTLAEHLGIIIDPEKPNALPQADPSVRFKMTVKEFAQGVLESPEYRASIFYRIRIGELPPQIEALLYHHAYGKPPDHIKVEDVSDQQDYVSVELIEQRMLNLGEKLKELRELRRAIEAASGSSPPSDEQARKESVH